MPLAEAATLREMSKLCTPPIVAAPPAATAANFKNSRRVSPLLIVISTSLLWIALETGRREKIRIR